MPPKRAQNPPATGATRSRPRGRPRGTSLGRGAGRGAKRRSTSDSDTASQTFQPSKLVTQTSTASSRTTRQTLLGFTNQASSAGQQSSASGQSSVPQQQGASSASGQSPVPQQQVIRSASGQSPVPQQQGTISASGQSPVPQMGSASGQTLVLQQQSSSVARGQTTVPQLNPASSGGAPSRKKKKVYIPDEPEWDSIVAELPKTGYTPLIEAAVNYGVEAKSSLAEDCAAELAQGGPKYFDAASMTLCMMPRELVTEMITGNVVKAYKDGSKTQNGFYIDLRELKKQGIQRKHAGIYLRSFADRDGDSLYVYQARWLIRYLRYYQNVGESTRDQAYRVDAAYDDSWTRKDSETRRKYLTDRPAAMSERRQVINYFCSALEKHIHKMEDNEFIPPFHYVGYALDIESRMNEHAKLGSDAGWFGSLICALINDQYRNMTFSWHFHVVCLLGDEGQAAIAEMLLAAISHSYYWTGLGINVAHCGLSVASIKMKSLDPDATINAKKREQIWTRWRKYLIQCTPLEENLEWHNDLVQKTTTQARRRKLEETSARLRHKWEGLDEFKAAYEAADMNAPYIDPAKKAAYEQKYKDIQDAEKEILKLHR